MQEIVAAVISIILLIASIYFGNKYRKFKRKLSILAELINEVNEAIADNKITKKEIGEIMEKATKLIADP